MKLTDAQVRHFKTFGYLGVPQAIGPEDVKWIIEEFEAAISKNGGKGHTGEKRTMFGAPIEHSAKFCALLDDPRITGILGSVIGDDFNYTGGDGNYYSGDTPWHPDGDWGQLFAVKLAMYLDPLRADTGALRVIPGSQDPNHQIHRDKINVNASKEKFGVEPKDYPGNVALETNPGDVVIFNHDTYHSAWGGANRRRMFTMNCTIRAKTPEEMAMLHKYMSIHSAGAGKFDTGSGPFLPLTLELASPQRMVHLEQVEQVHDEMFPQYSRYRDLSKYPAPPKEVMTAVTV